MSRGSTWSDAEVTALISIWGDEGIQEQLDGATRNRSIYVNISKKLLESGFERDWQQCKAKIKNLKGDYKKIKDHNGVTGNGRQTCKFYDKLDAILGHRPASAPSVLLDVGSSSVVTLTEPQSQDHVESYPEERREIEGKECITSCHSVNNYFNFRCKSTTTSDR